MADDSTPENIRVGYPEIDGADIPHPPLRAFCEYCLSVKPRDDYAERRHFDFEHLQPWLGHIMIVDYLPAEKDFQYRLYGTHIADYTGFDLTGRRVSEIPPALGKFLARAYADSVDQKRLVYTEHTRTYPRFSRNWHRVLCPVKDGDRIQVVICIVPVSTTNKEP